MKDNINFIFRCIALAMGIAVVILRILNKVDDDTTVLMLGIGLVLLPILQLDNKKIGTNLMKRYFKEIIILLIQSLVFYVTPMFAGPTDIMGMIVLIIISTFILSILIGIISKEKIKFIYPIIISLLFIPSIFMYYNDSALVHSLWYFVISYIGLILGIILNKIKRIINNYLSK